MCAKSIISDTHPPTVILNPILFEKLISNIDFRQFFTKMTSFWPHNNEILVNFEL